MSRADPGRTDRIAYYFRAEWRLLLAVAVTGVLYNVGMVAGPWFEGQMVQCLCDVMAAGRRPRDMVLLAAFYILTILFVQFMRYLKRLYVRGFANHISKSIKTTLYRSLLYQERGKQEDAGVLMTKIIADADACVEGMRKFTTEVFDTGVVMLAYLAMLFFYDWRLTLLSMLFPPLACFLAEKLKGTVTKNVALSRESSGRLNSATWERISNALTYRVYGQESNQNRAYEERLTDYERKAVRANLWENAMQPVYQVISMLGAVAIIWFGGKNVQGTGWSAWNIAAFTAYFSCYRKMAVKSSKAAKLFNAVQKAQVSWKRIKPYLGAVPAAPEPAALPEQSPRLCVEDVAFAYPGQPPLLSHVSFQAEPGQIIGITGEIASGKSTLGKILLGELPFQGRISLGNRVLSNQGGQYAAGAGYLGHQPELFSGTIEENIRLGKPGDVGPVLRLVRMEQEVSSFPEGIHTVIGNGGVRLSGGQQARIALARTLFHRQPLLILDDPFSAVDPETEAQIFAGLRLLAADSVVLLISHRLSLFPQLDRVLWIENGTAVFAGHDRLMCESSRYRALCQWQGKEGKSHDA